MTPAKDDSPTRPLRVGVLVDLVWHPNAGGHVKCWERFAEAACALPERLDLTVHFSGTAEARHDLAPNVRYLVHPPVFSTARLPFLSHVPDHTDLAGYHRGLARHLGGYDLIHTTDAYFAFARTAAKVAARRGIPLTDSVHTDTPSYTRVFTEQTIQRLAGRGWLGRLLTERLRLHDRAADDMFCKLDRHHRLCRHVMVSKQDEYDRAASLLPAERLSWLRRGIDRDAFQPGKRDRAGLAARHGIPEDVVLLLHAGRVDRGKNVMVLAEAVRRVRERGLPVHLLCAGKGGDRDAVSGMCGATCVGVVSQQELQTLYANADIFTFPSEFETYGNVVQEALTVGLPVVVSEQGGTGRFATPDCGVVLDGRDVAGWAEAIAGLAGDPGRRLAMGRAARAHAERTIPTWRAVLEEDLLRIWQAVARN